MEKSVLGLRPGSIIQDSYRVTNLLGEGGMGATFAGNNLATGHAVAIKVITPEFARQGQAGELFRREANLMRSVRNDAVVGYETTLMDKEGQLYLVMEYINGKPLSYYLDRGKRLSAEDVLKLGLRLSGGLAAMHDLDIVHRDISPDNVMIPEDDIQKAKLIDLGVASDTVGTDKSIIGSSFAGKIKYAAPEQLGVGTGQVCAASDYYSMGLVLMRAAGLEVPGADGSLASAIDARRADISLDSKVPAPLRTALEALLTANPSDRSTNPEDVFRQALSAKPAKSAPKSPAKASPVFPSEENAELPTPGRKTPVALIGIVAAVVVLLVAVGGWLILPFNTDPTDTVSGRQSESAKDALSQGDPFAEVTSLIDAGGPENLNIAFGALLSIARDQGKPDDDRAEAAFRIAQMYDPATYDPTRSPFPAHNVTAAKRFYGEARDLGHPKAQAALAQLAN